MTVTIRIGISGWTYAPWRGQFYPKGLRQREELTYVAQRMNSVEINGSFYSLQRRSSYLTWAAAVPPNFEFAVKGGRFITHMKKLGGIETPLANFFASGVLALGERLGPILWQLPPSLGFNPDRMDAFFAGLPRTAGAAAEIAAGHDHRVPDDHAQLTTEHPAAPLRHVVEVRHETFRSPDFYALLRRHEMGWCWRTTRASGRSRGADRGSDVCAVARARGAVRQWLQRRRTGRVGEQGQAVEPRPDRMSTSIATTTPRCARRTTRWV